MRHNYVFLPNIHGIGKTEGGNNAGQIYVSGRMYIEGMEDSSTGTPFTFFEQDFPALVAKFRSVFPEGKEYHGTSKAETEDDWKANEQERYAKAIQTLINGTSTLGTKKNWLLFPNGEKVDYELASPMFLKFSQEMKGRNGKTYKAGDIVPKNGSRYWRIDYKLKVFTRYTDEEGDEPVDGFDVERVVRNQLANRELVTDKVYNEDGSINLEVLKHIDPVDLHTLNGSKYNFNLPDITGKTGGTPNPANVRAAGPHLEPQTTVHAPAEQESEKPAEQEKEEQVW